MSLHKITKQTPDGIVTAAEWSNEDLRPTTLRRLRTVFDKLKAEGFNAVNVPARTLMQAFDPSVDILMLPDFKGGGLQTFQETLVAQSVAGSSFATYTTAKTVIPATNLITLPANWWYIGRSMKIDVCGAISNIVTTPGLMNFQVKIGSVAAFDTGNIQLNATAHTLLPFWLEILLTCRAVGVTTSANLMGLSKANGKMFTVTAAQTDGANTNTMIMAPATAPVVGTGFDSTIANILDLWVGFTISDAANLIRIDQMIVSALN